MGKAKISFDLYWIIVGAIYPATTLLVHISSIFLIEREISGMELLKVSSMVMIFVGLTIGILTSGNQPDQETRRARQVIVSKDKKMAIYRVIFYSFCLAALSAAVWFGLVSALLGMDHGLAQAYTLPLSSFILFVSMGLLLKGLSQNAA